MISWIFGFGTGWKFVPFITIGYIGKETGGKYEYSTKNYSF